MTINFVMERSARRQKELFLSTGRIEIRRVLIPTESELIEDPKFLGAIHSLIKDNQIVLKNCDVESWDELKSFIEKRLRANRMSTIRLGIWLGLLGACVAITLWSISLKGSTEFKKSLGTASSSGAFLMMLIVILENEVYKEL